MALSNPLLSLPFPSRRLVAVIYQPLEKRPTVTTLHKLHKSRRSTTADNSKAKAQSMKGERAPDAAGVPAPLPAPSANEDSNGDSETSSTRSATYLRRPVASPIRVYPYEDPENEDQHAFNESLVKNARSFGNAVEDKIVHMPQDSTKSIGVASPASPDPAPGALPKPNTNHAPRTSTYQASPNPAPQPPLRPTKPAAPPDHPPSKHPGWRPPPRPKQANPFNLTVSKPRMLVQTIPAFRKRRLSFSNDNDEDEPDRAKGARRSRSSASKPATAAMADIYGYRRVGILHKVLRSR